MEDEDKPETRKWRRYQIIIAGLIVHVILMFAVFDIYFSSPLDHGMKHVRSTTNPPAKRLVLFVADGLRAEAVMDRNMNRIPFLKSIIQSNGSWGISHTRVPTESRPGHVALLAGIYEDPSAILKGWKANPVYFDSVINQSTNAWCWGSPDILNIFNKDNLPHIHLHTYDAHLEDFGKNDTGVLDTWVFENVQFFFESQMKECNINTCDSLVKGNGNIFFLHLLGIDTAGHGFKPHSSEYINNIKLVDKNVEKISKLFNSFFKDNSTTFIFTADHGMTDWGSHGAGSLHETEAPFIAWGAGIKKSHQRQDIKQIDIAPLLASLIGINIPSNSLGTVPLSYLDMDEKQLAEVQLSNTLQLLEIFNIKKQRTERNALLYIPYNGLTTEEILKTVRHLKKIQDEKRFLYLIDECKILIELLMNGLDYYHNYYQYPLRLSVTIGFIGWILFLVVSVMENKLSEKKVSKSTRIILLTLNVIPVLFCSIQRYPLSYYLHFSFPFIIFTSFFEELIRLTVILPDFKYFFQVSRLLSITMYIVGIELLVYGFFVRASFSVLSVILGFWTFASDSFGKYSNKRDKLAWICLCLIMSIFPLLPVMKTSFNMTMYLSGFIAWIILFYEMFCRLKIQHQFRHLHIPYGTFNFQFACLIMAGIYSIGIEKGLIGVNSPVKYISWFLLIAPISAIPFTNKLVSVRLLATFFGFAPFYLLVSSNYEAIFSAVHVAVLCNWLLIEIKTFQASESTNLLYYINFDNYKSKAKISSDMFRRSFLFMVFIFLGFFGTGNIASLNSFDPMWVRAFLTVFSPFKMMGLILLKIIVPFIFTCCVFRAINSIGKENVMQMFCIILIFSDLMVTQFLFLITNKGSWLDIGTSLSHFLIMEGFVTILLLLYGFAQIITTVSFLNK